MTLALDYTYSYLRFADAEEGDADFSQGSAFLDLTLIKDAFYLETDADITQQLIDPEDGKILYSEDPDSQWHPASLTKIMTAYLAFEAVKAVGTTLRTLRLDLADGT
ncbi:MAG: hypothetical protein HC933_12740 [Pleurocapsa sp. SU_196_0]|nr:hypothetical protein [Pleurocapsa sp. SU_196_0]